jgi:uncharacterized protein (DUF3084 family)
MNAIVIHAGMPFPKGEIVPATAFAHFDRLVELGALEPTDLAATIEPPIANIHTLDDDELANENKRIKAQLDKLPGELATARREIKARDEQIAALTAELATAKSDAKAAGELADELQKQLANLAANQSNPAPG